MKLVLNGTVHKEENLLDTTFYGNSVLIFFPNSHVKVKYSENSEYLLYSTTILYTLEDSILYEKLQNIS